MTVALLMMLVLTGDEPDEATGWKPSQHVWIVAGAPLAVAGTVATLVGVPLLDRARDDAARAKTKDDRMGALDERNLGFGVLGFGLTAIAAAVMMIIYNAML